MVNYCRGCLNNSKRNNNISFFTYPKDSVRRTEWLKAIGREDLLTKIDDRTRLCHRICEDHFEKRCFTFSKNGNVKYLSLYAFPTLNLPIDVGASRSQCQNVQSYSEQPLNRTNASNIDERTHSVEDPSCFSQNPSVVVAETAIAPEDNDPVLCSGVKKEDVTEQCEDPLFMNSRCDDCQIIFISKDNFEAHRRNIHGRYRCSECQVGFKNEHCLHIHINSVHSYDIIYSCDYCQKKFTNKEYIQIHMKIAHSRGSFKHDECEHDQQSTCSQFEEKSGEGTLPPEVNAVASGSSEHQYEVFIKEEPELELGPVVLQHMDCNYRPYKEEPLLD